VVVLASLVLAQLALFPWFLRHGDPQEPF
jgi:hypothetical protein